MDEIYTTGDWNTCIVLEVPCQVGNDLVDCYRRCCSWRPGSVAVAGGILWAWDRSHFVAVRDFLASPTLEAPRGFAYFLRHIPKQFLPKRNRGRAVKLIDRVLGNT